MPQLESSLETYMVPAKHWANNEGITIQELILWGTQTVHKHHSVACVLIGIILGVMGNMGMDTRLNLGDKVRNGFLEEVRSKLTKTSYMMPREDKLFEGRERYDQSQIPGLMGSGIPRCVTK